MWKSRREGVGRKTKRNSRSCGVPVFMFYGEIELLREEKRRQRQYHIRTLIALIPYTIVAISLSSRPRFSSLRLVSHLCVSSLISSIVSSPISFSISPPAAHASSTSSHIDAILPRVRHPQSANTDKNELDKTAQPYRPTPAEPTGTRETRRYRHNIA